MKTSVWGTLVGELLGESLESIAARVMQESEQRERGEAKHEQSQVWIGILQERVTSALTPEEWTALQHKVYTNYPLFYNQMHWHVQAPSGMEIIRDLDEDAFPMLSVNIGAFYSAENIEEPIPGYAPWLGHLEGEPGIELFCRSDIANPSTPSVLWECKFFMDIADFTIKPIFKVEPTGELWVSTQSFYFDEDLPVLPRHFALRCLNFWHQTLLPALRLACRSNKAPFAEQEPN